ncbi:MAG TPA: site-2 protease family protein [Clostridiales bacterium]|nr:site-2 protease family protein [Clostridiales bacterium]
MYRPPIEILLSLPAVFLALSFHEFAHAWTAVKLGDDTPRNHGRLTLDPLNHVDWLGLILFILIGYGWARPVQVNPSNFRNKKLGDILVSLAGPISNFLLAVAAAVIYTLLKALGPATSAMETIIDVSERVIFLNIVFGLLNLIPIAPLDGYRVIKNLLFRSNIRFFMLYERYSNYILAAFLLLGAADLIIERPAYIIFLYITDTCMDLLAILL